MKKNLLYLLCVIALLTSCSTAYRSSQTPDDVYYSPGQKIYDDEYVAYNNSSDDNYLRMKARDHYRWSSIDDYSYWYDSRYYYNNYYSLSYPSFTLGLGYNVYPLYSYSSYSYNPWHSWYNPYCTVVYYKNPTVYYKPVNKYIITGYNNRNYNNYNVPLQNGNRSNAYNNSNVNRTRNNFNRNQNNSQSMRLFNSNSGGSSGGGARVSGGGTRTRP